jgi:hypothetical protein
MSPPASPNILMGATVFEPLEIETHGGCRPDVDYPARASSEKPTPSPPPFDVPNASLRP